MKNKLKGELEHLQNLALDAAVSAEAGLYPTAETHLGDLRTQVARVRKLVRERRRYAEGRAVKSAQVAVSKLRRDCREEGAVRTD